MDFDKVSVAEIAKGARNRLAASSDTFADVFVRETKVKLRSSFGSICGRQLQKQSCELRFNRRGTSKGSEPGTGLVIVARKRK